MYSLNLSPRLRALIIAVAALPPTLAAETGGDLTLAEAEQRALELDPVVAQIEAQGAALSERAVAEGQLPDPELSIGLAEVPLDDFDLSDHEDTEVRLGLSQAFPPGRTRRFRAERMDAMAGAEQARMQNQRLLVLRDVRNAYVDLYYEREMRRVLDLNRALFEELVEITERQYAAGRDNQHEVVRAQLELSLIEDRIEQTEGTIDVGRAELAKWVGAAEALRALPPGEPELPPPAALDRIAAQLNMHPLLEADDAVVDAAVKGIAIAEEQYKPQWMIDFMLSENTAGAFDQQRGPDFAGVFVKMSLPIFRDKRQDRQLAASRQEALAARFSRADRLRELTRQAESEHATLSRLERRLDLYRRRASIEANQTQEAVFNAYQNGLADFEELVRARALALETDLELLRIAADRSRSLITLAYLAGEPS